MQGEKSHEADTLRIYIEESKPNSRNKKPSVESMQYIESLGSALLYGVCSTSMAFLNKTVISSFAFDYPFFIMANQMILSILFLEFLKFVKLLSLPKYTMKSGKSFLWPSLFYALHSITSLHALGGMSIPIYAAIKRCAPIVTLILSVVLLHQKIPSTKLILSLIFITVGCILAGLGDLKFDFTAYEYGVVCVFAQGLYLTLAQKSLQSLSALEVLHISSINTVLIFIVLSAFYESHGILEYNRFSDVAFFFSFVLLTCMGVLLNFSLFYCTAKNSALTTSLVGVFKSIFQTVVGSFTFGGVEVNLLNVSGISMNLFGGLLYTYVKYKEKTSYVMPKQRSIL